MTNKTPLYDAHVACGGKMVDFAGWMMPVNYGSQIEEHTAVRTDVGMFDVSHMTIIDVSGAGAMTFLQKVVANDVARLELWQALYGALLNEQGGVLDDLIVYRQTDGFRCVVNASTRDKVLAWFARHATADMTCAEQDLAMIAVQGPNARAIAGQVMATDLSELKPFYATLVQDAWMVGRTGYTGEDGIEVMLPGDAAQQLWQSLLSAGVAPAGLGARDTLRLEAGLNLYGQDLDEQTSPLASNIGWTIAWEPPRDFIGRQAIEAEREQPQAKLTGLVMRDKGVLRHGQTVVTEAGKGVITSGTFSPTMGCSIALARLPADANGDCQVDIRGKLKKATIVQPPFVRNGKIRPSVLEK
ncbi:MAG: glycine cleavage system aminomethyltransferase GcvT [Pseudomonadales bacterium]